MPESVTDWAGFIGRDWGAQPSESEVGGQDTVLAIMGSDQTGARQHCLESDLFMAGDGMKGCGEGGHINKKPGRSQEANILSPFGCKNTS